MTSTHSAAFASALLVASLSASADSLLTPALSLDHASPDTATPGHPHKPTSPPPPDYGLLGDLFGHRTQLADQKFFFEGFVLLDLSKNFRGGIDTEHYAVRYLLDLHLTVDLAAFGLPGGIGYFDFQSHDQTENADHIVGDIQAYDNLEGPRYVAVEQLWWKQDLGNDFRLKIGRIDANTDAGLPDGDAIDGFSLIEHGYEFLHSAAALQPTMFVIPTFPNAAPGIQLFYGKSDGFYAGAGAFYSNSRNTFLNISGHPETAFISTGGVFLVSEAGSRWKWDGKPGHLGLGGWYHTGNFPAARATGERHRGAGGGYFLLDQCLYLETVDDEISREIAGFLTAGAADSGASFITRQVGLGLSARGFVPARPKDSFGVLSTWVGLSAPPDDPLRRPGEWATEAYYRIQLTDWASLTPSFAYITSPSGQLPDAAVTTLRIAVTF